VNIKKLPVPNLQIQLLVLDQKIKKTQAPFEYQDSKLRK
jgi:hypothetical protein